MYGSVAIILLRVFLYNILHFIWYLNFIKRPKFRIRVRATDRGIPELYADVDVELDVVDRNNKPPIWEQTTYGPIYVKENEPQGHIVTTVRARFVHMTKTDITSK